MKLPSSSYLKKRLKNLLDELRRLSVDGCIIKESVDLLYLTGLSLSAGSLIVFRGEMALFVDGRYIQVAQEKSPVPVFLLEEKNIQNFLGDLSFAKIAFDATSTSFAEFEKLQKRFKKYELIPVQVF